jgi:phosphoribosylanthranilate isomerase
MNWIEKTYKVKICGTTSIKDAQMAVEAGADYLGVLVDVPISERSLTIDRARAIVESSGIPVLILLMGKDADGIVSVVNALHPYGIHLLGQTPIELLQELKTRLNCQIWLTVYLPAKDQAEANMANVRKQMIAYEQTGAHVIVIDSMTITPDGKAGRYGGTGKVADWDVAKELIGSVDIPVFLAGGINPDNVRIAIRKVEPFGVDLASGVEKTKGVRDPEKVKKLMQEVRKASRKSLVIVSHSPEYTKDLGEKMGKSIQPGSVVALCGDLGSGKTVFAQGMAKGLGVESIVTSPTFVIINEYQGRCPFYHIDTYRLTSPEDMQNLGYEEYFYSDGVTVIEWAQKIEELLPEEHIRIEFKVLGVCDREITFLQNSSFSYESINA